MISYEELSKVFDMENPLTLEYFELCDKNTDEPKYFEKHHILPKSIFPEYEKRCKWNLVRLTYKDHYRSHEILPFICLQRKHEIQMICAWGCVSNTRSGEFVSAEKYIELRIMLSDALRGRKVSPETRNKMSVAQIGRVFSEETRKRMTIAQTGRVTSDATKAKLSELWSGEGNPMFGKNHTDEAKVVMREMKVLDVEPFLEYLRTETPFRLIGEYTAMSEPTDFMCDKHGLEFREKPTAVRYQEGIGCKECRNELRYAVEYVDSNLPLEKKKEIFLNYLKQNTNLQLVSEFVSMWTPAWFQCDRGHKPFEIEPVYVKRTRNPTRCKECSAEDRKAKKLAKQQETMPESTNSISGE